MTKNFIMIGLTMVIMLVGYGIYQVKNSDNTSNFLLENVEALTSGENDMCPHGCSGPGDGCMCNGYYPELHEVN